MKHASNSALRAKAREQLGGKIFGKTWMMALLAIFVASAIVSAGSAFVIVGVLLQGFLMVGLARIFLKLSRRGGEIDLADLFSGTDKLSDNLLLGLMYNLFIALWSLLFIIPGIVKSYAYRMAFYIKHDNPDYDWKKCIDESRKLMNGNKWRLFTLDLSFLGWLIVGALCFGVGTLWVQPYMTAAEANFYEDLVKNSAITE